MASGAIFLNGSERVSHDSWPGVVASVCDGWRIAVGGNGVGYRLQRRIDREEGPLWSSVGGRSLPAKLVREFADQVPGLAQAFEALPVDPRRACPALIDAQRELDERCEVARPSSPDYGRVVAQEGQLRISVDPAGEVYLLQWAAAEDVECDDVSEWRTIYRAAAAQEIARWIAEKVYDPDDGGPWATDKSSVARRAARLIDGLAPLARDGVWQKLPDVVRVNRADKAPNGAA